MKPKISVVVLCRNEEDYIDKCLQSLIWQEIDVPYEILVIDGMSDDGTKNLVKAIMKHNKALKPNAPEFMRECYTKSKFTIKLIDNKKKLTPYAWNLGFERAQGDYVAVVSGHATYHPKWLNHLYKNIQKPNIDVCGGIHISPNYVSGFEHTQNALFNTILGGFGSTYSKKNIKNLREVNSVAFALYKRDVIQKVGKVNTAFLKGQDMEYNYRIKKAGFKIWQEPRAIAYYRKRKSYKKYANQMKGYGFAKAQMMRTHKSYIKQGFRALIPPALTLSLVFGGFAGLVYDWLFNSFLVLNLWSFITLFYVGSVILTATTIKDTFTAIRLLLITHFFYGYGFLVGIFRDMEEFIN